MTIRYDISLEDLIAFQVHYLNNDRKYGSVIKWVILLFGLLVLALVGIKVITSGVIDAADVLFAGVFIVFLSLFKRLHSKSAEKLARKLFNQPGTAILLGDKELHLGEDSLELYEEFKHTVWKWSGILKACETNTHFFIYESAITAVTIPKRGMTEEETAEIRNILNAKTAQKS